MRNQFLYTDKVEIPAKPADKVNGIPATEARTLIKTNSFNVDMIIRTVMYDDEQVLVLLDDLHERWQDRPTMNRSGNKKTVREKDTFQSEITLSKEDGKRLLELTNIEATNNE